MEKNMKKVYEFALTNLQQDGFQFVDILFDNWSFGLGYWTGNSSEHEVERMLLDWGLTSDEVNKETALESWVQAVSAAWEKWSDETNANWTYEEEEQYWSLKDHLFPESQFPRNGKWLLP